MRIINVPVVQFAVADTVRDSKDKRRSASDPLPLGKTFDTVRLSPLISNVQTSPEADTHQVKTASTPDCHVSELTSWSGIQTVHDSPLEEVSTDT